MALIWGLAFPLLTPLSLMLLGFLVCEIWMLFSRYKNQTQRRAKTKASKLRNRKKIWKLPVSQENKMGISDELACISEISMDRAQEYLSREIDGSLQWICQHLDNIRSALMELNLSESGDMSSSSVSDNVVQEGVQPCCYCERGKPSIDTSMSSGSSKDSWSLPSSLSQDSNNRKASKLRNRKKIRKLPVSQENKMGISDELACISEISMDWAQEYLSREIDGSLQRICQHLDNIRSALMELNLSESGDMSSSSVSDNVVQEGVQPCCYCERGKPSIDTSMSSGSSKDSWSLPSSLSQDSNNRKASKLRNRKKIRKLPVSQENKMGISDELACISEISMDRAQEYLSREIDGSLQRICQHLDNIRSALMELISSESGDMSSSSVSDIVLQDVVPPCCYCKKEKPSTDQSMSSGSSPFMRAELPGRRSQKVSALRQQVVPWPVNTFWDPLDPTQEAQRSNVECIPKKPHSSTHRKKVIPLSLRQAIDSLGMIPESQWEVIDSVGFSQQPPHHRTHQPMELKSMASSLSQQQAMDFIPIIPPQHPHIAKSRDLIQGLQAPAENLNPVSAQPDVLTSTVPVGTVESRRVPPQPPSKVLEPSGMILLPSDQSLHAVKVTPELQESSMKMIKPLQAVESQVKEALQLPSGLQGQDGDSVGMTLQSQVMEDVSLTPGLSHQVMDTKEFTPWHQDLNFSEVSPRQSHTMTKTMGLTSETGPQVKDSVEMPQSHHEMIESSRIMPAPPDHCAVPIGRSQKHQVTEAEVVPVIPLLQEMEYLRGSTIPQPMLMDPVDVPPKLENVKSEHLIPHSRLESTKSLDITNKAESGEMSSPPLQDTLGTGTQVVKEETLESGNAIKDTLDLLLETNVENMGSGVMAPEPQPPDGTFVHVTLKPCSEVTNLSEKALRQEYEETETIRLTLSKVDDTQGTIVDPSVEPTVTGIYDRKSAKVTPGLKDTRQGVQSLELKLGQHLGHRKPVKKITASKQEEVTPGPQLEDMKSMELRSKSEPVKLKSMLSTPGIQAGDKECEELEPKKQGESLVTLVPGMLFQDKPMEVLQGPHIQDVKPQELTSRPDVQVSNHVMIPCLKQESLKPVNIDKTQGIQRVHFSDLVLTEQYQGRAPMDLTLEPRQDDQITVSSAEWEGGMFDQLNKQFESEDMLSVGSGQEPKHADRKPVELVSKLQFKDTPSVESAPEPVVHNVNAQEEVQYGPQVPSPLSAGSQVHQVKALEPKLEPPLQDLNTTALNPEPQRARTKSVQWIPISESQREKCIGSNFRLQSQSARPTGIKSKSFLRTKPQEMEMEDGESGPQLLDLKFSRTIRGIKVDDVMCVDFGPGSHLEDMTSEVITGKRAHGMKSIEIKPSSELQGKKQDFSPRKMFLGTNSVKLDSGPPLQDLKYPELNMGMKLQGANSMGQHVTSTKSSEVVTPIKSQDVKAVNLNSGPHTQNKKPSELAQGEKLQARESVEFKQGPKLQCVTVESKPPNGESGKLNSGHQVEDEKYCQSILGTELQYGRSVEVSSALCSQGMKSSKGISEDTLQKEKSMGMTPQPRGTEYVSLTPGLSHQVMDTKGFTPWHQDLNFSEVSPRQSHTMTKTMGLTSETWPQVKDPIEMARSHHQIIESTRIMPAPPDHCAVPIGRSQKHQVTEAEVGPVIPLLQEMEYLRGSTVPQPMLMDPVDVPPELENVQSEHLIPHPRLESTKSLDITNKSESGEMSSPPLQDTLGTGTQVVKEETLESGNAIKDTLDLLLETNVENMGSGVMAPEPQLPDGTFVHVTLEPCSEVTNPSEKALRQEYEETETIRLTLSKVDDTQGTTVDPFVLDDFYRWVEPTATGIHDHKSAKVTPGLKDTRQGVQSLELKLGQHLGHRKPVEKITASKQEEVTPGPQLEDMKSMELRSKSELVKLKSMLLTPGIQAGDKECEELEPKRQGESLLTLVPGIHKPMEVLQGPHIQDVKPQELTSRPDMQVSNHVMIPCLKQESLKPVNIDKTQGIQRVHFSDLVLTEQYQGRAPMDLTLEPGQDDQITVSSAEWEGGMFDQLNKQFESVDMLSVGSGQEPKHADRKPVELVSKLQFKDTPSVETAPEPVVHNVNAQEEVQYGPQVPSPLSAGSQVHQVKALEPRLEPPLQDVNTTALNPEPQHASTKSVQWIPISESQREKCIGSNFRLQSQSARPTGIKSKSFLRTKPQEMEMEDGESGLQLLDLKSPRTSMAIKVDDVMCADFGPGSHLEDMTSEVITGKRAHGMKSIEIKPSSELQGKKQDFSPRKMFLGTNSVKLDSGPPLQDLKYPELNMGMKLQGANSMGQHVTSTKSSEVVTPIKSQGVKAVNLNSGPQTQNKKPSELAQGEKLQARESVEFKQGPKLQCVTVESKPPNGESGKLNSGHQVEDEKYCQSILGTELQYGRSVEVSSALCSQGMKSSKGISEDTLQKEKSMGMTPQPRGTEYVSLTPGLSHQVMDTKGFTPWHQDLNFSEVSPRQSHTITKTKGLTSETWPQVKDPIEMARSHHQIIESTRIMPAPPDHCTVPIGRSQKHQVTEAEVGPVIPLLQEMEYLRGSTIPQPMLMDPVDVPPELENVQSEHLIPHPRLESTKSLDITNKSESGEMSSPPLQDTLGTGTQVVKEETLESGNAIKDTLDLLLETNVENMGSGVMAPEPQLPDGTFVHVTLEPCSEVTNPSEKALRQEYEETETIRLTLSKVDDTQGTTVDPFVLDDFYRWVEPTATGIHDHKSAKVTPGLKDTRQGVQSLELKLGQHLGHRKPVEKITASKQEEVTPGPQLEDMKSMELRSKSELVKLKSMLLTPGIQAGDKECEELEPKKQGESLLTLVPGMLFQDKPMEVLQGPHIQDVKPQELTSRPDMQVSNHVMIPCLKQESLKPVNIDKTQGIQRVHFSDLVLTEQYQGRAPMDLTLEPGQDDQITVSSAEWEGGMFDQLNKQFESVDMLSVGSGQEPKHADRKPVELVSKLQFKDTPSVETAPEPVVHNVNAQEEVQYGPQVPSPLSAGSQVHQVKALEPRLEPPLQDVNTTALNPEPQHASTKSVQWIPISESQREKCIGSNFRLQSQSARPTGIKSKSFLRTKPQEMEMEDGESGLQLLDLKSPRTSMAIKVDDVMCADFGPGSHLEDMTSEVITGKRAHGMKSIEIKPSSELQGKKQDFSPRKMFLGTNSVKLDSGPPLQDLKYPELNMGMKLQGANSMGQHVTSTKSSEVVTPIKSQGVKAVNLNSGPQTQNKKPSELAQGEKLQARESVEFKQGPKLQCVTVESKPPNGESGKLNSGHQVEDEKYCQSILGTELQYGRSVEVSSALCSQGMKSSKGISEDTLQKEKSMGMTPQPRGTEYVSLTPGLSHQVMDTKGFTPWHQDLNFSEVSPRQSHTITKTKGLTSETWPQVKDPIEMARSHHQIIESTRIMPAPPDHCTVPIGRSQKHQVTEAEVGPVIPLLQEMEYLRGSTVPQPMLMDPVDVPPELENVKSEHLIPHPRLESTKSLDITNKAESGEMSSPPLQDTLGTGTQVVKEETLASGNAIKDTLDLLLETNVENMGSGVMAPEPQLPDGTFVHVTLEPCSEVTNPSEKALRQEYEETETIRLTLSKVDDTQGTTVDPFVLDDFYRWVEPTVTGIHDRKSAKVTPGLKDTRQGVQSLELKLGQHLGHRKPVEKITASKQGEVTPGPQLEDMKSMELRSKSELVKLKSMLLTPGIQAGDKECEELEPKKQGESLVTLVPGMLFQDKPMEVLQGPHIQDVKPQELTSGPDMQVSNHVMIPCLKQESLKPVNIDKTQGIQRVHFSDLVLTEQYQGRAPMDLTLEPGQDDQITVSSAEWEGGMFDQLNKQFESVDMLSVGSGQEPKHADRKPIELVSKLQFKDIPSVVSPPEPVVHNVNAQEEVQYGPQVPSPLSAGSQVHQVKALEPRLEPPLQDVSTTALNPEPQHARTKSFQWILISEFQRDKCIGSNFRLQSQSARPTGIKSKSFLRTKPQEMEMEDDESGPQLLDLKSSRTIRGIKVDDVMCVDFGPGSHLEDMTSEVITEKRAHGMKSIEIKPSSELQGKKQDFSPRKMFLGTNSVKLDSGPPLQDLKYPELNMGMKLQGANSMGPQVTRIKSSEVIKSQGVKAVNLNSGPQTQNEKPSEMAQRGKLQARESVEFKQGPKLQCVTVESKPPNGESGKLNSGPQLQNENYCQSILWTELPYGKSVEVSSGLCSQSMKSSKGISEDTLQKEKSVGFVDQLLCQHVKSLKCTFGNTLDREPLQLETAQFQDRKLSTLKPELHLQGMKPAAVDCGSKLKSVKSEPTHVQTMKDAGINRGAESQFLGFSKQASDSTVYSVVFSELNARNQKQDRKQQLQNIKPFEVCTETKRPSEPSLEFKHEPRLQGRSSCDLSAGPQIHCKNVMTSNTGMHNIELCELHSVPDLQCLKSEVFCHEPHSEDVNPACTPNANSQYINSHGCKPGPYLPTRAFDSHHSPKASCLSQAKMDSSEQLHQLEALQLKIIAKLLENQVPRNVPPPFESGLVLKYPICLQCGRCSGVYCPHKLKPPFASYLLIYPQIHFVSTPEGQGQIRLDLGFSIRTTSTPEVSKYQRNRADTRKSTTPSQRKAKIYPSASKSSTTPRNFQSRSSQAPASVLHVRPKQWGSHGAVGKTDAKHSERYEFHQVHSVPKNGFESKDEKWVKSSLKKTFGLKHLMKKITKGLKTQNTKLYGNSGTPEESRFRMMYASISKTIETVQTRMVSWKKQP